MITEIIQRIIDLLNNPEPLYSTFHQPLLTFVRTGIPLIRKVVFQKLGEMTPEQVSTFNYDFDMLLHGISQKDYETVALVLTRYNIPVGGWIERVISKMMHPLEPQATISDDEFNDIHGS